MCEDCGPLPIADRSQVKRRAPAESCVRRAQPGDMLSVNFTGWLYESGAEFDRSAALYGFRLGDHQVISGWEIGLTGYVMWQVKWSHIPQIHIS